MAQPRLTLPRRVRLSGNVEFKRVFEGRCSEADDRLIVYAWPNGLGWSRLGITASRKLGGSVVRNRLKRLVREAFRLDRHDLPAGFDYVVLPRPTAPPATLAAYRDSLRMLVDRAVAKCRRREGARL